MTVNKSNETETPPAKHTQCNEQVPSFGASLKLHKKNALRFTAKSHQTSLSQLPKWMSRAFNLITPVSEDAWRVLFMIVGIVAHSNWAISNSEYIRGRMSKMKAAGLRP